MHTLAVDDEQLASIMVLDEAPAPPGRMHLVARLRDGRSFRLALLTLAGLQRHLEGSLSYVAPRVLLVREASPEAIVEAVRVATAQGLEHFGTLEVPLGE